MGLLDGIRVDRSSDPEFRKRAVAVDDYFVDVEWENEIVRARAATESCCCTRARIVTSKCLAQEYDATQITPTRDTRLRWMQSVIGCTHYVAGRGRAKVFERSGCARMSFSCNATKSPNRTTPIHGARGPMKSRELKIGITCFPLIGGSGILATALGSELAARGHEVHFFSYAKPVRLDLDDTANFFSRGRGERKPIVSVSRLHPAAGRKDGGDRARECARYFSRALRRAARHRRFSGAANDWRRRAEDCHDFARDRHDLARTGQRLSRCNRTCAHSFRCGHDCLGKFTASN